MLRLNKKIQSLDNRIEQHRLKYKCVLLKGKDSRAGTAQVQVEEKKREQRFSTQMGVRPRLQSLDQLIAPTRPKPLFEMNKGLKRKLSLRSNNKQPLPSLPSQPILKPFPQPPLNSLSQLLTTNRHFKDSHEFIIQCDNQKCMHLQQLTREEFEGRQKHLMRIVAAQRKELKPCVIYPRDLGAQYNPEHYQVKDFKKSSLAQMIRQMPQQALRVQPSSSLPRWVARIACTKARCTHYQAMQPFLADVFSWHFHGPRTLFFIDTQSYQFVRVEGLVCRGGQTLYKLQERELSQIVNIITCYREINHILFFERKLAASPLVYVLLADQNSIQYELFFFEGPPQRELYAKRAANFFDLLQQAYNPHLLRLPLPPHARSKKVVARNLRGQFFEISLDRIALEAQIL